MPQGDGRAAARRVLAPHERLTSADVGPVLDRLDMSGNVAMSILPDGLTCHRIRADNSALATLAEAIRCRELVLDGSAIESIADSVVVQYYRMSARGCQRLKRLPARLRAGIVDLRECLALETLPEGMTPSFLDLEGCSALRRLPEDLLMSGGRLGLRDCPLIVELPRRGSVAQLDISGCRAITTVPEEFAVTSWIDIGGSGLVALPPHLRGIGLRWRGVPIDERIAFRPEELAIPEVLEERNAEVRRVMLERFGFEAFMAAADAEVLDTDRDPGGERKLLRVALERDEPLVCVSVFCPSTERRYFLRVPPHVGSCRQAIAWTAGFDDPKDYAPLIET